MSATPTPTPLAQAPQALAACRTAVVELPGGPLWWDVTAPVAEASAESPAGAPAGNDAAQLADPAALADLHHLALLNWAEVWWPTGFTVPPLDPGLLAAEKILAVEAAELDLDDPDALDRALVELPAAVTAVASLLDALPGAPRDDPWDGLRDQAHAVMERLRELADDHGIVVEADPLSTWTPGGLTREGLALAAGGADFSGASGVSGRSSLAGGASLPGQVAVAAGSDPIVWKDLPPGVVPADATVDWTITMANGRPELAVTVPRLIFTTPRQPSRQVDGYLWARFGPKAAAVDCALVATSDGSVFTGGIVLDVQALALPRDQQRVHVYDERYGAGEAPEVPGQPSAAAPADSETSEDRQAVIDFALRRLANPQNLAERATAWAGTGGSGGSHGSGGSPGPGDSPGPTPTPGSAS